MRAALRFTALARAQSTDDAQLAYTAGGFYSHFLIEGVTFGEVKELNTAVLLEAKRTCARSLCDAMDALQRHYRERCVDGDAVLWKVCEYLVGDLAVAQLVGEKAAGVFEAPSAGDKAALQMLTMLCGCKKGHSTWLAPVHPNLTRLARSTLQPLYAEFCLALVPAERSTDGSVRRECTVADFAQCTLPTCTIEMAVRKLTTHRTQQLAAGKKAQWKHEHRAGSDIPNEEAFSLHTNAGGIQTADGEGNMTAGSILKFSKRIHYVMKEHFQHLPNPNADDLVKTALSTMKRIIGTSQPMEADALWDERSSRLFDLIDVAVPRDRRFAASSAIAENAGFRVSEVYLMDRFDLDFNARGVATKLPRHKASRITVGRRGQRGHSLSRARRAQGDQESAISTNQIDHNKTCSLAAVGHGWLEQVTAATACSSGRTRCGACCVGLYYMSTPYARDEDGPLFLVLPPTSRWSFQCETCVVGEDTYYVPSQAGFDRRAQTYKQFNTDLKELGVEHNKQAADRGWPLFNLSRLSFHGFRHGAITNAFFLQMQELAICVYFRVRDPAVMKHYICKKLGLLMPGNPSATAAGSAAAARERHHEPSMNDMLRQLYHIVMTSTPPSYPTTMLV